MPASQAMPTCGRFVGALLLPFTPFLPVPVSLSVSGLWARLWISEFLMHLQVASNDPQLTPWLIA